MELVLEHIEIINLLREALTARGFRVSAAAEVKLRRNNKKGTLRVVFITRESPSETDHE